MTLPNAALVGVIVVLLGLALAFARYIETRYKNRVNPKGKGDTKFQLGK
jgi:hypothetical protein